MTRRHPKKKYSVPVIDGLVKGDTLITDRQGLATGVRPGAFNYVSFACSYIGAAPWPATLTWSKSDRATSYRIEYSTNGTTWGNVISVAAENLSNQSTVIAYSSGMGKLRIVAVNAYGETVNNPTQGGGILIGDGGSGGGGFLL